MPSSLAQKFLCIWATSAASECTFSTGDNIVTNKRNCLKSHVVDQLVFLAKTLDQGTYVAKCDATVVTW